MKITYPVALVAGLALTAVLAVGCGDDSTSTVKQTATEAVSTATPTPKTSPSAVAGVSADYKTYVSQVCKAGKQFKDDIATTADKVRNDPQNAFDAARVPFDNLANNLKATTPPPDLQSWQQQVVDKVNQVSNALKGKDVTALTEVFQSPFPPVPDNARGQLQAAAKDNPDCSAAGLFGS
ncbi:MAG: hypothetical protein IT304_09245 [Dehalococcoidia bacterium]|nr:hypothetical protein [Dehalococcoidia bacterium]